MATFSEPSALRRAVRDGVFSRPTTGQAGGFLQGNLAILPKQYADDFLAYCVRNPKPCPLLGVSEPGRRRIDSLGLDLDISTDVPFYRLHRDGTHETVSDLDEVWRDDLVSFVIGCSFSFEESLQRAKIPVRHIEAGRNVPMYVTNIETRRAGPFHGPMVVSMRAFSPADAIRATVLSDRQPLAHGAPVHFGDPALIGVKDLLNPEFGDTPVLRDGDVPVFWACGVTPQMAIRNARPDIAITHEPGFMLVTDVPAEGASIGI
ncbi:MAG: putative hydro-lyase [Microvirga sp.]|nr:putative hydro-lyase [Microvirga sp.]